MLQQRLNAEAYVVYWSHSEADFLGWVGTNRHRIDCLVIEQQPEMGNLITYLRERDILLPSVLLVQDPLMCQPLPIMMNAGADPPPTNSDAATEMTLGYHSALTCLAVSQLEQLEDSIHQAIDQFLKLPATKSEPDTLIGLESDTRHFVLSLQQQRLTEKLKERLGYLGVYYKRNPQNFLRNMSRSERQELLNKLRLDYRNIVLSYFAKNNALNQQIDDFVNIAFFADISVAQIVEIHMELMDNFSKQLQLEGRSEEILLDYRLTLIDVIAHLCEMYRRSIPREL